jgi:hypothetical protein
MDWCLPVTESADQKQKISELRWYRGTPVVLILDEACFCFFKYNLETNAIDDIS